MNNEKDIIVVSGINFFEGGPLTIMQDVLETLSKNFSNQYKIIALVSDKKHYLPTNIEYLEFPKSRSSWFLRLYYEFIYFKKLSKKIQPKFWFSMHDITPNIIANYQFVYCHNPAPFFKPTAADRKYGFTTFLFSKFYIHLYKINIQKNKNVIVQQQWLREEFEKRWKLNNVIVAYPEIENKAIKETSKKNEKNSSNVKTLIYPSFPRSFKNFELICNAYELLGPEDQIKIKIYLTIDESLNKYAKMLVQKYKKHSNICFVGILKRKELFEYYLRVDGLIFPSRLETWGLPITEFKNYNKPIFAADLPYAKETVGNYDKAVFFDVKNPKKLAELYKNFITDNIKYDNTVEILPQNPFLKGWKQLFNYVIENEK